MQVNDIFCVANILLLLADGRRVAEVTMTNCSLGAVVQQSILGSGLIQASDPSTENDDGHRVPPVSGICILLGSATFCPTGDWSDLNLCVSSARYAILLLILLLAAMASNDESCGFIVGRVPVWSLVACLPLACCCLSCNDCST